MRASSMAPGIGASRTAWACVSSDALVDLRTRLQQRANPTLGDQGPRWRRCLGKEGRPEETIVTSGQAETGGPDAAIPNDPFLLYDGECPFCSFYAAKSRFEERIGRPLRLIDGRHAPELVTRLRREGCDLDQGMILALHGRRYHGAAAMVVLKGMTTGTGRFGRFARWFTSSPARIRAAYPWLRRLRRAVLVVKGVPRLQG